MKKKKIEELIEIKEKNSVLERKYKGIFSIIYFFRKFKIMYCCLKQVEGDKCRTQEVKGAIKYIFLHPSHLFKQKAVKSNYDSVLKNVNCITNYPYFENFYFIVTSKNREDYERKMKKYKKYK